MKGTLTELHTLTQERGEETGSTRVLRKKQSPLKSLNCKLMLHVDVGSKFILHLRCKISKQKITQFQTDHITWSIG